jgi:hypothetical protein
MSDDPLDLGEALWLSHWQLSDAHHHQQQPQQQQQGAAAGLSAGAPWARHVSAVSLSSLDKLWSEGYFDQPLTWRLGFREFGTSIGLQVRISHTSDARARDEVRDICSGVAEATSLVSCGYRTSRQRGAGCSMQR